MSLKKAHHEAWTGFFVAHGLLMREIDKRLAEAQVLSLEVYDVLLTLELAPDRRMRMSDLADAVLISRSGLTRQVDRLEKEGLIRREACPGDRRALYAAITDKGLAERERTWPIYREAIAQTFGGDMSDEEAAVIRDVSWRIAARLRPGVSQGGCPGNV